MGGARRKRRRAAGAAEGAREMAAVAGGAREEQEVAVEEGEEEEAKAMAWLRDDAVRGAWLRSRLDLVDALERSDGLIRVDDFLPPAVAELALGALKRLPGKVWSLRSDKDDARANTTQHAFDVVNGDANPVVGMLTKVLSDLLPEKRCVFSAAKYDESHHITEHDDHALVDHQEPGDRKPVRCSRDIAVIYYLTKDWDKDRDGGVLVDLQTHKEYTPRFNSMVAFVVPRFHEVTAVKPRRGRDPRYSLFGWFLAEGDIYKYVPDAKKRARGGGGGRRRRKRKKKTTWSKGNGA